MLFKQKKALVISDFDGTICTVDVGNGVLSQFTQKSWDEIDREYVKGSIGSRDGIQQDRAADGGESGCVSTLMF